MCSTADVFGISDTFVQGDKPEELEEAAPGLGQSSPHGLHKGQWCLRSHPEHANEARVWRRKSNALGGRRDKFAPLHLIYPIIVIDSNLDTNKGKNID